MSIYFNGYSLLVAAVSYLLGCFNGSILVSKYILRNDIRNHGSGNAGLTNFYRTFGGGLTFLVILSDVLKAVLSLLVGARLFSALGDPLAGKYLAALFVMVGHMFPVMFRFRGGKGILSGGTVVLMLDWRIAAVAFGLFLVLVIATKWVSLGSVAAALTFPIRTAQVYHRPAYTVLAAVIAVLVIWKHRENIKRMIAGREPKFSFRKKEAGG